MRAWLEIDCDKLGRNVERVRAEIGSTVSLIAVVKTNAYGHGLPAVVQALDRPEVAMLAVADADEAFRARQVSRKPLLILGHTEQRELTYAIENGIIVSAYDKELLPLYERTAARLGQTMRVHVKVETGLNRLGMSLDEATDFLTSKRHFPHVRVEGIYSHLADAPNPETDSVQLQRLQDLLVKIQGKCDVLPVHLGSSGALGVFPAGYLDAVRVGGALYGLGSGLAGLEPIMTAKTVVIQTRPVAAGEEVGYTPRFRAKTRLQLALLAIGYGEGLSVAYSGKMAVLLSGEKRPVIGRVAMNIIAVDATGLNVKRGDEAVVIGSQKDDHGQTATLTVAELAKATGIRHYEVTTRLGASLPKFYQPR
ncbi:MAG TPA: alanine racemase [Candidatus Saccharimonadales bacterium]|nr:alanine racemase [Candidatus Saccharimonadales bacterium]